MGGWYIQKSLTPCPWQHPPYNSLSNPPLQRESADGPQVDRTASQYTTTLMDAHDVFLVMRAQVAPRAKNPLPKKAAGKKGSRGNASLNAIAEYSLTGFL